MKIGITGNAARYADDVAFIAGTAAPYQVSAEIFAQVCALINNAQALATDRTDAIEFFALACDMAVTVDSTAQSIDSVYRAACEAARRQGFRAYGDPPT